MVTIPSEFTKRRLTSDGTNNEWWYGPGATPVRDAVSLGTLGGLRSDAPPDGRPVWPLLRVHAPFSPDSFYSRYLVYRRLRSFARHLRDPGRADLPPAHSRHGAQRPEHRGDGGHTEHPRRAQAFLSE